MSATDTSSVTVIDLEDFEAAQDDPSWRAFCERADQYLDSLAVPPKDSP